MDYSAEVQVKVDRQSKMDNILERSDALNEHLEDFRHRLSVIVNRFDGMPDNKEVAGGVIPSPISMTSKLHGSLDRRETIQDQIRDIINVLDEIV